MLRLGLYLGSNLAILVVLSGVFRLLGIDSLLQANGVDLNLTALLIFAAVLAFAGSLISLFLSKTMAKAGMRVQVITTPRNPVEHWLMVTEAEIHLQAPGACSDNPSRFFVR
ncbi:M48 family metallopeptidase [Salipiger aestuarii]|uniref:Heat shock protein HtpX n=1 Tax=Salipiger aestuarii TaxID=568098 RepID=A0A327XLM4_9RHOB|nr:HtpX domain protein [Salipiger aestuarii]EIE52898.1 HtpX domain protein [Citreicella sp. 357]KAA8607945.1 hypothetical protein AL037_18055 [Salipiger aestuarii]KAB2535275.1 hypothetical protein AL035_20220 [Salipiger aestuarii]RAK08886.1 heat shock protein HtpX [Salipiger aestuarii]